MLFSWVFWDLIVQIAGNIHDYFAEFIPSYYDEMVYQRLGRIEIGLAIFLIVLIGLFYTRKYFLDSMCASLCIYAEIQVFLFSITFSLIPHYNDAGCLWGILPLFGFGYLFGVLFFKSFDIEFILEDYLKKQWALFVTSVIQRYANIRFRYRTFKQRKTLYCSACKTKLRKKAIFCPICGQKCDNTKKVAIGVDPTDPKIPGCVGIIYDDPVYMKLRNDSNYDWKIVWTSSTQPDWSKAFRPVDYYSKIYVPTLQDIKAKKRIENDVELIKEEYDPEKIQYLGNIKTYDDLTRNYYLTSCKDNRKLNTFVEDNKIFVSLYSFDELKKEYPKGNWVGEPIFTPTIEVEGPDSELFKKLMEERFPEITGKFIPLYKLDLGAMTYFVHLPTENVYYMCFKNYSVTKKEVHRSNHNYEWYLMDALFRGNTLETTEEELQKRITECVLSWVRTHKQYNIKPKLYFVEQNPSDDKMLFYAEGYKAVMLRIDACSINIVGMYKDKKLKNQVFFQDLSPREKEFAEIYMQKTEQAIPRKENPNTYRFEGITTSPDYLADRIFTHQDSLPLQKEIQTLDDDPFQKFIMDSIYKKEPTWEAVYYYGYTIHNKISFYYYGIELAGKAALRFYRDSIHKEYPENNNFIQSIYESIQEVLADKIWDEIHFFKPVQAITRKSWEGS